MTASDTPTPRTDVFAALDQIQRHARTLERDLAAAQAELEKVRAEADLLEHDRNKWMAEAGRERAAREEVERDAIRMLGAVVAAAGGRVEVTTRDMLATGRALQRDDSIESDAIIWTVKGAARAGGSDR